jgi:hypothetical protein
MRGKWTELSAIGRVITMIVIRQKTWIRRIIPWKRPAIIQSQNIERPAAFHPGKIPLKRSKIAFWPLHIVATLILIFVLSGCQALQGNSVYID